MDAGSVHLSQPLVFACRRRKHSVLLCKKFRHIARLDLTASARRRCGRRQSLSHFRSGFAAFAADCEETVLAILSNEIDAPPFGRGNGM